MKDVWNFNSTTIHPLGAFVLFTCAFLILLLHRKWIFIPVLIILSYISDAQRINIAGLDFTFARVLILAIWFRIFIKHEYSEYKFQKPDLLLLMWLFARGVVYSLQWGNREAVIYQLGEIFTTCGFYFMARMLIRNSDDVKQFGRQLAIVALPTAVFFAIEWLTARNYFSIFGGVEFYTWVRDGRLRCGGAYTHPLIAGYFWGVAIPFIATLYDRDSQHKKIAITGVMCSLIIVVTTASSTPVLGVMAWVFGWCLYFIRKILVYIVISMSVIIIVMHIYMRAPVWHLIARVGVVGGSTGDHRYRLLDSFLRNVGEWFLLGTKSTAHWGHGLRDVTNEFILQAVRGGFITLLLFSILVFYIMAILQIRASKAKNNRSERFLTWQLWSAMFMQISIFFALSIFGQASILFYICIGICTSVAYSPVAEDVKSKLAGNVKVSAPVMSAKDKREKRKRDAGGWIMPDKNSSSSNGGWI